MPPREGTIRGPGLRGLFGRRESKGDGFQLVSEERERHAGASRGNAKRSKLHAPRYFDHQLPDVRLRGEQHNRPLHIMRARHTRLVQQTFHRFANNES